MMDHQRACNLDATTMEAQESTPTLSAVGKGASMLLLIKGGGQPRAVEIPDGAQLTLGRAEHADIVVADPSLSRLHARISRQGDSLRVIDLSSRNGTWIGGQRVSEAALSVGSAFAIGSVSASVQVAPAPVLTALGLLGSAAMLELLDTEASRSKLFRRPLSVLLVRALSPKTSSTSQVALHCVPQLRPVDRAAPYERQSLLVLLPETDAASAWQLAERLAASANATQPLVCGIASLSDQDTLGRQLVERAERALERCSAERHCVVADERASVENEDATEPVVRHSSMLALRQLAKRLAPRRIGVLVVGETGTGKELIARELHRLSGRRGPLKVVNCAAIPASLVESLLFGHVKGAFTGADCDRAGAFVQAHGGTLFLDEVGELSASAQAALLRVLDTQRVAPVGSAHELEVDVRVIAATHRDLAAMSRDGSFRLDLFHRLNGATLQVPPLRERRDDIALLADYFIAQLHGEAAEALPRLSEQALERMQAYAWPGNVRELRNVVERALALTDGELIEADALPSEVVSAAEGALPFRPAADAEGKNAGLALRPSLEAHEIAMIREALRRTRGNQRRAAILLDLPLRTFERKLKILGLRARPTV